MELNDHCLYIQKMSLVLLFLCPDGNAACITLFYKVEDNNNKPVDIVIEIDKAVL